MQVDMVYSNLHRNIAITVVDKSLERSLLDNALIKANIFPSANCTNQINLHDIAHKVLWN